MAKRFYMVPEMNQMSAEGIRKYQESKLPGQLKYCYDNSEFYRQKFDDAGAGPEDIRTMDDLRKLPVFMVKDDERKSAEVSLEKYFWRMVSQPRVLHGGFNYVVFELFFHLY